MTVRDPTPDGLTHVAVLMPAFEEEAFVERAVRALEETPPPPSVRRSLIAVDDGSRDATADILDRLARERDWMECIRRPSNAGKGAALADAWSFALLHTDAHALLIHDADLEYDPRDHHALLAPILDRRADAVIGSRFLGSTHRVLYYWHYVANRAVTTLSNMLTNLNLSDIECCLKAFTRATAQAILIEERGFGVEPELVAKVAKLRDHDAANPRVFEVAVSYNGRTYAEGKKIRLIDGFDALRCIIRYGLGPHAEPRPDHPDDKPGDRPNDQPHQPPPT